jgi:hypothetical protein
MSISRRKFLLGMTAAVATPAVIRWSGIMPINAAQAQPYVIVHGLNLSGKEVIHKLYDPMSVSQFTGTTMFENMSTVHNWVYVTPKPMSEASQHIDHWNAMQGALSDRTVDQIIADRILKEEQRRKEWREDPAWTIYGTIGTNDFTSNKFTEDGPIRNPWELL